MNVADQTQKIGVFFTDDRFIPVLKNMPVSVMTTIIVVAEKFDLGSWKPKIRISKILF